MEKTILYDATGNAETIVNTPTKDKTDYRERMLNEYTALVIRKNRLIAYLLDLPEDDASLMTSAMWEQVSAMDDYEIALRKRILIALGVEV